MLFFACGMFALIVALEFFGAAESEEKNIAAQSNVPKASVDWSELLNKPTVFGEGNQ